MTEIVVHALKLPMPLHAPETACGVPLTRDGKQIFGADGNEHEVIGVHGPDARVTCKVCAVLIDVPGSFEMDPSSLPQVQRMEVDNGGVRIEISAAQNIAAAIAGQFLAVMKEMKATNFLEWQWSMDFNSAEIAAMVLANPETPWDSIELVTYCRKGSGLSPAGLAEKRQQENQELRDMLAQAHDALDRLMGDSDREDDDSFEMRVMQKISRFLEESS